MPSLLASNWLGEIPRGGLRFKLSEADILFSSPINQKQLLNYHLLRLQSPLLFSTLIICLLVFLKISSTHFMFVFPTIYLMLNFVVFHNLLGILLLQRLTTSIWQRLIAFFIFCIICFIALFSHETIGPQGIGIVLRDHISFPLSIETCHLLLTPFRLIIESLIAENLGEFIPGVLFLLSGIFSFYVCSLMFKGSFKEKTYQRIERTAKKQKNLTAKNSVITKNPMKRDLIHFFPKPGAKIQAILWKNLMAFHRHGRIRFYIISFIGTILFWLIIQIWFPIAGHVFASIFLLISLFVPLFGPALLRLDFRSELDNLELLKSLPISSRDLMFGQIFITSMVLSLVQIIFITISTASFYFKGPLNIENTSILLWGYATAFLFSPIVTFVFVVTEKLLVNMAARLVLFWKT